MKYIISKLIKNLVIGKMIEHGDLDPTMEIIFTDEYQKYDGKTNRNSDDKTSHIELTLIFLERF